MPAAPVAKHADAADMADTVRIAVTNTVTTCVGSQAQNHFMQWSHRSALPDVLAELVRHWGLVGDVRDFALAFEASKEYVTDRNKHEIINGTILKLCQSPQKIVRDLIELHEKKPEPEMKHNIFSALLAISSDHAVAEEIVSTGAVDIILNTLRDGSSSTQNFNVAISTFYEIMRHEDVLSWDERRLDQIFIGQVAAAVSDRWKSMDDRARQQTLSVLESFICTPSKYEVTESQVPVVSVLDILLQSELTPKMQQAALALFNALFRCGDRTKKVRLKQSLEERQARRLIVDSVVRRGAALTEEMRSQLYILQMQLLGLLKERLHTKVESHDHKAVEKIKELRKLAFDPRGDSSSSNLHLGGHHGHKRFGDDYRKLGFRNEIDPTQDFREIPPGMLALDMMYAFACTHTDQYTKIVLENTREGYECPFAQTAIEILRMMWEVINSESTVFCPVFLAHEQPLEELFAVVIQHTYQTFREMRATREDFRKVMDVAREQMAVALRATPATVDEFRKSLKSYGEISEGRREEAKNRSEREGKAVRQLRRSLTPEVLDLIQRQRLGFLVNGTRFSKGKKERGKFVFCRLSPNHKALHYGDCSSEDTPTIDNLPVKLPVAEIKDFIVGPTRDPTRKAGKTSDNLTLTFLKENDESLDLLAPDQKTFDYWTDGMCALLRREMKSQRASEDLEMLLSTEVKIRLLPLEGIDIPEEPPKIPPLPPTLPECFSA